MLVTKLTVRGRIGAQAEGMAAAQMALRWGGLVKKRPEGGLYHYLTGNADRAATEWSLKGYDLTGREDVEMSDDGLERLLADLDLEPEVSDQ